jgi:hypothetical protein
MKLSYGRRGREVYIIIIILIIVFSNGLLFYFQNIMEKDLRNSLFEQQKQLQIESTKETSQHIGSDISLIISMLDGLTNSIYLQQEHLSSEKTKRLIEEKYNQYSNVIDRLFILNKDNIMTISLAPKGSDTFLNADFSFRDWVKETRTSLAAVFSGDFEKLGVYRVFITLPIINRDTNQYIGIIGTSILTEKFFAHYGNINDINSQFLVAFDKKGTILANGANRALVGQNFFGDYTQQFINHNKILNDLTRTLLAGHPDYAVYDYGKGERLTTQYPVFINGKPTFFISVVTPTEQIYSDVSNVLSVQRVKMFSIFAGTSTVAIAALVVLLSKWNIILTREVKKRTKELEESYHEMKQYLEKVLEETRRRK